MPVKTKLPREVRHVLRNLHARATTLLNINPQGFFTPYKYAAQVQPAATPYAAVLERMQAGDDGVAALIMEISKHLAVFRDFGLEPQDPLWTGSIFPPLDGAAAYTLARKFRPAKILEIGSGNSTHFLARALRDGGIAGKITCIDPAPRRALDGLGVEFIQRLLREEDASLCAGLGENDILFIDSSHIMLPGMDVDIQFNRLFPALAPGVIVHVHDIFLPWDYPARWRARFYSEQNALIGWILSGYFDVVFPGHYALRAHGALLEAELGRHFPPLAIQKSGSLWLRRAA
jgi:predicted O-methyltransferase YrrM